MHGRFVHSQGVNMESRILFYPVKKVDSGVVTRMRI
jgi:hypothetical protein